MEIILPDFKINFQVFELFIQTRNFENIFQGNKKRTLRYTLNKALSDKKNRLHNLSSSHLIKYDKLLDLPLGDFLMTLKNENNQDYKLYLNKNGDDKYCIYKINKYQHDRGIYCYIVNNDIKYIGRSKKTFNERFKDYGKITPYNCLINGQSTNCHINSLINSIENISVGIYVMNSSSDNEINLLESILIMHLKPKWNVQKL